MAATLSFASSPIETPQLIPDIRHTNSLSPLSTPHRNKARLGSLSPGSIPSSPTSVHSNSSAIFERDIEPLPLPPSLSGMLTGGPNGGLSVSHATSSTNPHRTPRGRQVEDSAVPSVLATAASVLVSLPVSPAPSQPGSPSQANSPLALSDTTSNDGFVVIAPTSQFIPSASPSLLATSPSGRASREQSPTRVPRRQSTTGSMASGGSPPPPTASLNALSLTGAVSSSPPTLSAVPPPGINLHMGEAATGPASHRLSFVSYNDLLLSAPTSTVPLSTLTQPSSSEPPPHIPALNASASGGPTLRSGSHTPSRSRPRSVVLNNRASVILGPDEGGEWEREGLGRGLEERLEELLRREQAHQGLSQSPPSTTTAV